MTLTIGCRAGGLEDAVLPHPRHDRVDVAGTERRREAGQSCVVRTPVRGSAKTCQELGPWVTSPARAWPEHVTPAIVRVQSNTGPTTSPAPNQFHWETIEPEFYARCTLCRPKHVVRGLSPHHQRGHRPAPRADEEPEPDQLTPTWSIRNASSHAYCFHASYRPLLPP